LAGLHGCCSDHERLSGSTVNLDVGDGVASTRLPAPVEIQLTRIVQEALGNVRKHAPGVVPTVRLGLVAGELTVEIEDDGPGFEPGRPRRTGWPHFGLQTMKERAEAIGGAFAVESGPGAGTRIVVRVPLAGRIEVRHASLAG
jgi:signal transduction histidine kinase